MGTFDFLRPGREGDASYFHVDNPLGLDVRVEDAGVARKVARLFPLCTVKG